MPQYEEWLLSVAQIILIPDSSIRGLFGPAYYSGKPSDIKQQLFF